MNPEIKAQWIAALRSGEYEQGNGKLSIVSEDGTIQYCCLGVLTDLAVKAGVGVWDGPNPEGVRTFHADADVDDEHNYLHAAVRTWSGIEGLEHGYAGGLYDLPSDWPSVPFMWVSLANLNDNLNWNFAQIANFIEENL